MTPKIERTHTSPAPADAFDLGKTEVIYTAWDKAGNNNTCVITIVIKGKNIMRDKVQSANHFHTLAMLLLNTSSSGLVSLAPMK